MNENILNEVEKYVILESNGETKIEAYSNVFTNLRKKIYDEVDGLVIYMEPIELQELETYSNYYQKKFLGLFIPKDKVDFFIKVKIKVKIKFIKI